MEMEFICGDCNMGFRSPAQLEKHRTLFCIGGEVGQIRIRHSSTPVLRDRPGCVDPKQTRTPDLFQLRGQRRNISMWRNVDANPKLARAEDKATTSQTESAALQDLTHEFHSLRMSIEESLPKLSKKTTDTEASGGLPGHSERLEKMREMATLHEHQLALIHDHNQQLEQQRDELAHQVSVLSEQSNMTHLESLLMELREQEERNEETLQQLAEHLNALQVQEVSAPSDQPNSQNKKMHHDSYKLISSMDDPLSTQIKALQQAYMQSGGVDPTIVAQMINLQAEAQMLEKNQPAAAGEAKKKKKVKPLQLGPSWELLAVEQENQRLEEEIFRMQLARERHHDAAARTELELIQREYLLQIASLQAEMERSKKAPRPRRQPPPTPPPPLPLQSNTHIHPLLRLLQARSFSSPLGTWMLDSIDSLGPAPYDPVAGFVIFYDLLLGVDFSQRGLRLVAGLFSEGQAVGPPTALPPFQGLPVLSQAHTQSLTPGNCTLLSVKQPVPRIQPSPSLSLVVEVQAARDLDVHNEVVLASCGWARMELFDQYNQLCSGHWRVPVRSLPIRPSFKLVQLNSIPQVGNMELCIRLVNGRDGDFQTEAKPGLTSTSHYKYPAVVSSHLATIHGNAVVPGSAPPPTGLKLSSLLSASDQEDPQPTEACQD